jgi:hypothetical protein
MHCLLPFLTKMMVKPPRNKWEIVSSRYYGT